MMKIVIAGAWRVLLALAVVTGGAEAAVAQERDPGIAAFGYIAAGVSGIATGELDDRLATQGYPTFGRTAVAVSIGAYGMLQNGLMLGGEWHGLIMGEETQPGREVGLGGGYGTFGIGYAMDLSPRIRVYPRLGLGGGGLGLWVEPSADTVGFDEALEDPEGQPEVSSGIESLGRASMVVDLGAGAEILSTGPGLGPVVGIRLGYVLTPFAGSWQLVDRPVSGGPSATIAGPYLRVTVGVGRRR